MVEVWDQGEICPAVVERVGTTRRGGVKALLRFLANDLATEEPEPEAWVQPSDPRPPPSSSSGQQEVLAQQMHASKDVAHSGILLCSGGARRASRSALRRP